MLLEINNLHKNFGKKNAVNGVSFTLEKAEILGILGESGSGKTTLLHLIAALQEPDLGELLLEKNKITPPSQKLIAGHPNIKLVRQDYGLFPNMTIRENINYELRFYEEKYRIKRVDKLLKISGLQKIQDHLPRQISGGEQQRAVIIKAIAEEPKLLLLDEPFSHLDARNKQRLKKVILQIIKEDKVACIFVTHDVSDAFALADRLAIMKNGKFIQIGNPAEVYAKPYNQYIAEITGDINIIPSEDFTQIAPRFAEILPQKNILIRPEKIRIVANKNESDFSAIVEKIQFLGNFYEIKIKVSEQVSLNLFSFDKPSENTLIYLQIADYQILKN